MFLSLFVARSCPDNRDVRTSGTSRRPVCALVECFECCALRGASGRHASSNHAQLPNQDTLARWLADTYRIQIHIQATFRDMLLQPWPAMEDKKATLKIVRLRIRHSMQVACLQTVSFSILERRRNKSHSQSRSRGLRATENITRLCFIERPNSNLLISSGFFFFHRGLPFLKCFLVFQKFTRTQH